MHTKRHWLALCASVIFIAVLYWHNQQKYLVFQTLSPDADRFSQAIWQVWHGRFLYSTIQDGSILGNHFSPYFALLSPLVLVWQDIRILYLAQILHIAAAGLILYKMVDADRPRLALPFLCAYLLNPQLHQIALFELRRIPFAMPWLALIIYSLHTRNRKWLLVGTLFTLLVKEDMGLIVFAVGLFVMLRQRDWRWGVPLMVLGVTWTICMLEWVIPAFGNGAYPQLNYFSSWGDSPADMVTAVLSDPVRVLTTMFDTDSLTAIGKGLLPLAIVLPFLGIEYMLICVPLIGLMLLSNEQTMHNLGRWYLAPVLPFLFAAVAQALLRLPEKWERIIVIVLLLCTLVSYRLDGRLPGGRLYEAWRYTETERTRAAWQLLSAVPDDAHVMAQVAYLPHISQRPQASHYPWNDIKAPVDYVLLAEGWNAYPYNEAESVGAIADELINPNNHIALSGHGLWLLQPNTPPDAIPVGRTADKMHLQAFEIAFADQGGLYQAQTGTQLRVSLYWEALETIVENRAVSVRVVDGNGALVAQHDSWPANGMRPTATWQPGQQLRDMHDLVLPNTAVALSLELLIYDATTQAHIPFSNGDTIIPLGRLP